MTRLRNVGRLLSPGDGPPLREVTSGAGWYPLVVLTTLNVVDELDRAVLGIFAPNIRRYFDIGNAELGALVGAQVFMVVVLAVPIGYLGTKVDRARILRWSAAIWTAISFATYFATRLPWFVATRLGVGISKAAVDPVGKSLLTDYYPPGGWNRVLAVHTAANPLGLLIGPALAGAVALFVVGDGVWRWAFPVLAVPSVLAVVGALRLREPENQMVRAVTGAMITVTGAPSGLGFWPATRRLLRITTFKRQLIGVGVLGFGLVALLAFVNILFEEEFGVGEQGRALIGVLLASAALLGNLIGGNVGERIFTRSPAGAVRLIGGSIAAYSLTVGFGVWLPSLGLLVAFAWISLLGISVAAAPLATVLSAISPPRLRPLMFSLLGICIALFGGVFGGALVGAIADATNLRLGLTTVVPFGVAGGLIMATGARTIDADIAAVAAEVGGAAPVTPAG